MGLYLAIFNEEGEDIAGVECGRYADFADFRKAITNFYNTDWESTKFQTLLHHSDCDGEWSVEDVSALKKELQEIKSDFCNAPVIEFKGGWQVSVSRELGLNPANLAECFIDVDGEPLFDRLLELCEIALAEKRPIEFQ